MITYKTKELFDLSHTLASPLLSRHDLPWQALPELGAFLTALLAKLPAEDYHSPRPDVRIARSATVAPDAVIIGPCIIGPRTEIRVGAYLRGNVLIGEGCVVGNSCEIKNAILFDGAQVPHFNYVGDSILGYRSHLGAGAITSNQKSDKSPVTVHVGTESIETSLRKCGCMLGDFAEIGCQCVLNPGTVIGQNTTVYPLSSVRGVIPSNSILKSPRHIVTKRK